MSVATLTPAATLPAMPTAARQRKLDTPICVYSFTFHRWAGEHRIHVDSVKQMIHGAAAQEEIAADRVRPVTVQLIPRHWTARLSNAFGQFQRTIDKLTLPFVGGSRALPLVAQESFWVAFRAAEDELNEVLDEFVAAYPTDVVDAAYAYWYERLGHETYHNKLAPLLPAPDAVRKKFGVTPMMETIAIPKPMEGSQPAIVAELSQEARNNKIAEINAALDSLFEQPAARLAKEIDNLTSYWNQARSFSRASLNGVRSAIELVHTFRELAPATLVEHALALRQTLDDTEATIAKSLDPENKTAPAYKGWHEAFESHKDTILALANDVAAMARDSRAIDEVRAQYGRRSRAIE